jgi:hypothetical protein
MNGALRYRFCNQQITTNYNFSRSQTTTHKRVGCISDSVMHQTRNVILNDVFYMDAFGVWRFAYTPYELYLA